MLPIRTKKQRIKSKKRKKRRKEIIMRPLHSNIRTSIVSKLVDITSTHFILSKGPHLPMALLQTEKGQVNEY